MTPRAITIATLLAIVLGGAALFLIGRSLTGDGDDGERPAEGPPAPGAAGGDRRAAGDGEAGAGGPGDAFAGAGEEGRRGPARSGGEASGPATRSLPGDPAGAERDGGAGKTGEAAGLKPLGGGDAAIAVRVEGPDGQPLPGAAVEIRGSGGARSAPTGADGTAELAGIPAGTYEVRVRPPGLPPLRAVRAIEVAPGGRAATTCRVPAFDGEIAGRVLDEKGSPVAGIEVEARPIGVSRNEGSFVPEGTVPAPAATGADGAMTGAAPRATRLSAPPAALAASGAEAEPGVRPKATGTGIASARGPSETRPEGERLKTEVLE